VTWHLRDSVTEARCILHNAPRRLHELCAKGCNDCPSSRVLVHATQPACHALPCRALLLMGIHPGSGIQDVRVLSEFWKHLVGRHRQGADVEDAGVGGAAAVRRRRD
jgi:hypothetical protein